eukprot:CAMPEP_0118987648 /NCGR_PEP_ID=MMETSP1173-20130426/44616_1 /TAXON_ID=1034831 /ORGANISM="Rhizochromulina marina cf, Strain CCMP1243" /LENGTH=84 /DNA_ID=CAMNT_0006938513 /DNA_START=495 /DNA_END=745 /DNA_ORIENTATION=-
MMWPPWAPAAFPLCDQPSSCRSPAPTRSSSLSITSLSALGKAPCPRSTAVPRWTANPRAETVKHPSHSATWEKRPIPASLALGA